MHDSFATDGYAILRAPTLGRAANILRDRFQTLFRTRFGEDPATNRNLIKRFAGAPEAAAFFGQAEVLEFVRALGLRTPVHCGPLVSHYTASDLTGGGYGLPFHQDFPSMASSENAVILWMSLMPASLQTHGLEVIPGAHKDRALSGQQEAGGYVLDDQSGAGGLVLEVAPGDIVAMDAWLPHRTYVHPEYDGWKLSLSQRFDDLDCAAWGARGYGNAYGTVVDRDMYGQLFGDRAHG